MNEYTYACSFTLCVHTYKIRMYVCACMPYMASDLVLQGGAATRIRGLDCRCRPVSVWPIFEDNLSSRAGIQHCIDVAFCQTDSPPVLDWFDRSVLTIMRMNRAITSELVVWADMCMWVVYSECTICTVCRQLCMLKCPYYWHRFIMATLCVSLFSCNIHSL